MAKLKSSDNPYLQASEQGLHITEAGQKKLEEIVTNPTGKVYSFTKNLSPVIVAAAMARLSRRAGDMRLALLDEFVSVDDESEAEALIERVVTGYGDDSVQQLITVQIVVEEASNLLTKLLEWGRLGSYLEQSTRYIYFDQKDEAGRYLYYTPANLDSATKARYQTTMDTIFEHYSQMVRDLTTHLRSKHPEPSDKKERAAWINSTRATACDAVRAVLPAATKATVGIVGSTQAIESLVIHLLSEPLEEAQLAGQQILTEARKVVRSFLRRADMPERGGASAAYRAANRAALRELAKQELKPSKKVSKEVEVNLVDYWPRQENDLIPELLFEASNFSIEELRQQVAKWTDEEKQAAWNTYIGTRLNRRHRPGRAIEKAHFEWEVVGDYGTFRDLQRHRMVDAFEWQSLSPAYGYEIPELVQEAGFRETFATCFKLAEELYTLLFKKGFEVEAQYATLFGHRMRYRFLTNLREAFHMIELRTGPDGHPGYRKICNRMFDELEKVYPRAAAAMQFVNQRENPELTRQAAELATQYKLEKLGALGYDAELPGRG